MILFRSQSVQERDPMSAFFPPDYSPIKTTSGINVTPDSSMTLSSMFRAVENLAGHIAMLPLPVIGRSKDEKGRELRNRLFDDPLDDLLNTRTNPSCSAVNFKRTLIAHRILWGNGYAEIVFDGQVPVALYNIHPSTITVAQRPDGMVGYTQTTPGGARKQIDPANIIHIFGLSSDGVMGHVMHRIARENVGLAMAIERYAATYFGNGAMPKVILSWKGNFGRDDDKRKAFRQSFDTNFGRGNAHKTALLEDGMEAKVLASTNEAAQVAELLRLSVKDICRWGNIPPHLLYELSEATYNNIDQMARGYVTYSMGPIFAEIEQELNHKLIPAEYRATKFVELNADALLRGDTETRYRAHKLAIEGGFKNRNEVRQIENMNPAEGLDEFIYPMNYTTVGQSQAGVGAQQSERLTASARSVAGQCFGRANRRVCGMAIKAARSGENFVAWVESVQYHCGSVVGEITSESVQLLRECGAIESCAAMMTRYWEWIRQEFLTVAECRAANLVSELESWSEKDHRCTNLLQQ